MSVKEYFDKVNKKIDELTDEEFDQLLIDCGIENRPYQLEKDKELRNALNRLKQVTGMANEDMDRLVNIAKIYTWKF